MPVAEDFYAELEKIAKDVTWLRHPDATTGFEQDIMSRPPFQIGVMDIPDELVKTRSPFIQYHRSRGSAQHWSNEKLLRVINKKGPKKFDRPHVRALLDEARGRGLELPSEAPKEDAYLKPPVDPFGAYAASFLGSLVTGGLAGKTLKSKKDVMDLPESEVLERFLRRKDVRTVIEEGAGAHFTGEPTKDSKWMGGKVWKGGRVVIDPKDSFATLAHEAGHATGLGRKTIARPYGPSKVYGMLGLPAATLYALVAKGDVSMEPDKEKRKEKVRAAQAATMLAPLPYLPVLAEEARASARAAVFAKRLQGNKGALIAAARLLPAFGTYAAPLLGPMVAYKQLGKRLQELEQEKGTKKKQKPMKKAASSFAEELRKIAEELTPEEPAPIPAENAPGTPVANKPASVVPTPPELSPEEIERKKKLQRILAKKRFKRLHKLLKEKGVDTGAQMKRLAIPKRLLTEKDMLEHLGFKPVVVAVPEVGQKRFQSYRHPITNHHIHDHGDTWVMHEDSHPSTTMLWEKSRLAREGKLKDYARPMYMKAKQKAKEPMNAVEATVKGMPHLLGEGVPGMALWTKAAITGLPGMKERVLERTDPTVKRRFRRWKASRTFKPPTPETPTAIAGSVVNPSPTTAATPQIAGGVA